MKQLMLGLATLLAFVLIATPTLATDDWDKTKVKKIKQVKRPPSPIPEPSSALLFGAGALVTAWALRRRP